MPKHFLNASEKEHKRCIDLLCCLQQEGPARISPEYLLNPIGTRPQIGIVAHYSRISQIVFDNFQWGAVVLLMLTIGGSYYWNATEQLAEFGLNSIVNPWTWEKLGLILATLFLLFLIAVLLIGLSSFLLSRLSFVRDSLSLDLNGLFYVSPQGRCYSPWLRFYALSCWRTRWIKLFTEEGGTILLRVPEEDRDWLAQVIDLLLQYHQADLHGNLNRDKHTSQSTTDTVGV